MSARPYDIAAIDDRPPAGAPPRALPAASWARTYDAEYLALARLLDCRVVTVDARLLHGTRRLGFVVAPSDL